MTNSQPLSSSSSLEKEMRPYASVLPVACRPSACSFGRPPSEMKTSAKDGSPMTDCSLKTAILRTESSLLPRRSTISGMLMFSIPSSCCSS